MRRVARPRTATGAGWIIAAVSVAVRVRSALASALAAVVLIPALALGQSASLPEQVHTLPAAIVELERVLLADVAADEVGSLAAAVIVGDSVVWQAAFGPADRDAGTLAASTGIYRVGSISKSITALVLLSLVERGVVALDDAVEGHVPEVRSLANRSPAHRAITLRDLAAHTAGLAREPATSHAARGPYAQWRRALVGSLPATDVVAPPGAEYRYSNIGYALLGLALERAAGRPYEELVRELVFEPLGMTSSFLVLPKSERHRLVTGYVNLPGDTIDPRVPRAEHRGRGYKVPNGGVYSTVGDLARLAMAMTGALGGVPVGSPLRQSALVDQAPAPRAPATGRADAAPTGYGLGFQTHRIGDTVIAGHSGTVAGYTAYLAFDPRTRIGVVLLRSYNRGATNLGATAARLILELGEELRAAPPSEVIGKPAGESVGPRAGGPAG